LHFLRSYSALHSFERARRVAQLDKHTAGMTQVMVQLVLRIAALLTVMAGTTLTFEILGDPWWAVDSFFVTHADDRVSFLQMVYWIVVSITTVGYGDFAPKTVITRVLTIIFIVVGVASVYLIQYSFSEMRRQQHEGTGKYWQRNWGEERHVVVILCHNGSASRMASLIHGFLQELLHASHNETEDHHDHASSVWAHIRLWLHGAPPAHQQTWPDVVFLSPTKWAEDGELGGHGGGADARTFRKFLEATEDFPSRMLRRIWFLVGSITSEADLERARVRDSALTYVLSDLKSATPDEDDAQTIYSAVVIRDLFPDVRLRLMVMKPESKELAVQAGIDASRCFSSRELSASLLAQNARCRGLIPAVTAMFKSADVDDEEYFLRQASQNYGLGRSTTRNSLLLDQPTTSKLLGFPSMADPSAVSNCRSLEELEKTLRKSQTHWCPLKKSYERVDPWMFEFFEGASQCVFGFDLHARYEGLNYGPLVLEIYRECGAVVLGIQHNGRLLLCPQSQKWRAKEGQVCFAVARSAATLDPCRLNQEDRNSWRNAFQAARRRRRHRAQQRGRHVDAARLMGKRLQQSLLQHLRDPEAQMGPRIMKSSKRVASAHKGHADLAILPPSPSLQALDSPLGELNSKTGLNLAANGCFSDRQGLRRPAALSSVRTLRQNLSEWEDLVVLIVCHGEIWQQVRTFVATLRQEYLPCLQPVVVLAPTSPPPGLLEDCGDRVVCMQGSSLRAQALIEAGVLEAGTVVVLAGEVAQTSNHFDYRVVLTGQELECWLGTSPNPTFTAFELHDSRSARHLPRLRMKAAIQSSAITNIASACIFRSQASFGTEFSCLDSPKTIGLRSESDDPPDSPTPRMANRWEEASSVCEEDMEEDEKEGPGIEDSGHRRRSVKEWLQGFFGRSTEEKSHDSILYHPRFAAGQVFTPELWGMMLGRMFYMPAVIELIEALVMPSRREQVAYPWQVRIPSSYIGLPFSQLLADLALGMPLTDVGEEAEAQEDDEDERGGKSPTESGTPQEREAQMRVGANNRWADGGRLCPPGLGQQPSGPPAVPIALYRLRADFSLGAAAPSSSMGHIGVEIQQQHRLTAREVTEQSRSVAEGIGGHHFLMLAPQLDTHLRDGDWVIVLGGRSFGRLMHERGLLRGSQPNSNKC